MADNLSLLKHLRFNAPAESLKFGKKGGGGGDTRLYHDDRDHHARHLKSEVARVELAFEKTAEERELLSLPAEFGLTLNVVSEPGVPLAFESLNNVGRGKTPSIILLNLRFEDHELGAITKAAVFVPFGQLKVLQKKIEAYSDKTKDKKKGPANAALLANIASISVAVFEALWTDPEALPGFDDVVWFELWVRKDEKDWEAQLRREARRLNLELPTIKLSLPEHIVMVVRATRRLLESSLDLLNTLSEVRIARPCSVGLTDLQAIEQEEWIDEALERIQWPDDDAPAVCLIDSGVNRSHPLIEPILYDDHMETVFSDGDLLHPPSTISDPPSPPDTGFRVLKIDSSNMADVYYQPDEVTQDGLALQVDNLKLKRKPEDLLFQVLLDWGVDLTLPISREIIKVRKDEGGRVNYEVFFVAENALAACFDTGLDEAFVKELAKRQPLRAVFRDSGYASDAVKINFEQIFKALSPHTELKTL